MGGAPAWSELPGERTLSAPGQGGAGPGPSVPTELRPPPHRACPLPGSQPRSSPPPLTGPHRRVGICAAPGLGTAEPGLGGAVGAALGHPDAGSHSASCRAQPTACPCPRPAGPRSQA